MKIAINNSRKIVAIQEEFNHIFPYLKLEFFSKPHQAFAASSKKTVKKNTNSIKDCRTIHIDGEITITPNITVNELEQKFADVYGLSVQVFRKSGKSWLETTVTDGWTLEEQNSQGKDLSEMGSGIS